MRQHSQGILLAPLVSWVAPANRGDLLFLEPSVRYCRRHLDWTPDVVVGDLSYLSLATQRRIREQMHVAVLTKLRSDMSLPDEFDSPLVISCEQGQQLNWLGLDQRDQLHWFGVTATERLCTSCWQNSTCAKEFSFPANRHEILYGSIPFSTRVAQRLLLQARAWVEPAQSYEKNRLGLAHLFLNSLRFSWIVCLLADTAVLLRARALLCQPQDNQPLHSLLPKQLNLDLQ